MKLSEWMAEHGLNESEVLQGDLYYLIKETVEADPRLLLSSGMISSEQALLLSKSYVALRQGVPLAYILGSQPFLDLNLAVTPAVLIPRADTEQWVRMLLSSLSDTKLRVLDIGTGSGCIAIALKHYRPQWEVWACDQSRAALETAANNAKANNVEIQFRQWDLYAMEENPEASNLTWDLIVSNPPYLTHDEWVGATALHVEPTMALVDKEGDGLSCYRAILQYARKMLLPSGKIWLEHGSSQRQSLMAEVVRSGMKVDACYDDDGARERVMVCRV